MNDRHLSEMEIIAQQNLGVLDDVKRTIIMLKGARHIVSIVKSKYRPLLISSDLHRQKIYLIDNLLRLDENPIRWWLRNAEISIYNTQPIFTDPSQINMALAILIMGEGLNSQGLTLELGLGGPESYRNNMIRIIDQNGNSIGAFNAYNSRRIVVTAPTAIQITAFEALLDSRSKSSDWNLIFHGLQFTSLQSDRLPEHISTFVHSV